MTSELTNYLIVGAVLFALGALGFLTRRNLIVAILSAEMMLLGVTLNLVAFSLRARQVRRAGLHGDRADRCRVRGRPGAGPPLRPVPPAKDARYVGLARPGRARVELPGEKPEPAPARPPKQPQYPRLTPAGTDSAKLPGRRRPPMSDTLQAVSLWLIPGCPLAAAVLVALFGKAVFRSGSHRRRRRRADRFVRVVACGSGARSP